MEIHKAFKFRLYPNKEQREFLAQQFGACRWVYNHFLRQRIDHYAEHKEGLTYRDNASSLVELKKEPETGWLQDVIAQPLQQTLMDLQAAYRNFFERRTKFPQFKSKRVRQSFRVPQSFSLEGQGKRQHLKIPKMSPIRIIVHRPIEGEMKSVTISKTRTGKYYASILCEVEIDGSEIDRNKPIIGVDLGLIDFAVTSEGERFPNPKYLCRTEKRLRRAQCVLSRRQKGSGGWHKARQRVAKLHEKVANQRQDFLHKLSRKLVDESQAIFFEDLAVKNMMANHCLAKSIGDSGWGMFVRFTMYKGQWYGCLIEQVDRFAPSSKRCSDCGHVVQSLPLSVREWACPNCGVVHDRDGNAAQNIKIFGLAQVGQGLPKPLNAGGESVHQDRSPKPEAPPLAVG